MKQEEEVKMSDEHTPTEINLRCLFFLNWLDDNVINNYLELLRTVDDNVFVYTPNSKKLSFKMGLKE